MDWVGVVMVVAVLVMGVAAALLRRRMDSKFREVAEAKEQLAQFLENRDKSPEAAASAANAASNAIAAAVPAGRRAKPSLRLVRDDEVPPGAEGDRDATPGAERDGDATPGAGRGRDEGGPEPA